jgi:protein SCO1/2
MLCNLVLNGLTSALREVDMKPGEDYRFVAVSIDPRETYELAAAKKKNYIGSLDREGADTGWVFHVGAESQSKALADALGFEYYWDDDKQQFAHPAVVFLLSPDGKISRYLYGIEFDERDVRLGLLEASEGKVGSTVDKLILYCFHYDPESGGYVAIAANIMKLGGLFTLVLVAALLTILWLRDRHRKSSKPAAAGSSA